MAKRLNNITEIRSAASGLLKEANAEERLPTPVDDLVAASGLHESDDYVLSESKINQAPKGLQKLLRSAGRKISGVLDRRERILHVNPNVEMPARRQFVRCHEVMHDILPWQREILVAGDTVKTLSPQTELWFEREANQGAAELLFQLDLLKRIARDYATDISTPIELAELFGASIHSTFRRWIEEHWGIVCGIVLGLEPEDGAPTSYRRFEIVESERWVEMFGRGRFPRLLNSDIYTFLKALQVLLPEELDSDWSYFDRNGQLRTLRIQAFSNGYRRFVLTWIPEKEGFVARHRRKAKIVTDFR